jgi:serine/threonine-protein kinase
LSLEPGSTLGHYEVVRSLGAGGMGEVYRARDTRLGREVAIKLLLEEVATDRERLARFEREARVLASLNHLHIATLYGFESDGRTRFLVMELVEGETLADRIARGPIPVGEAIPLFLQIAEGLEAAHEKGIVHRDLKPSNVKLDAAGRKVKILDFGLAKALAEDVDPGSANQWHSPTLTLAATGRGQILGTAAYMAPEQAKGRTIDRRADVWAFGVCLFEALAGKRAFQGRDTSELIASVLMMEPRWETLPGDLPRPLERLLRRCLEKDPQKRLRDIGDAQWELEQPARRSLASPLGSARSILIGRCPWPTARATRANQAADRRGRAAPGPVAARLGHARG